MDAATRWVRDNEIEVCILDNGLQQVEYLHLRELHSTLRAMGVRRGIIHHDLAPAIDKVLLSNYRDSQLSWPQAGHALREQIRSYAASRSDFEAFYMIGSPLVFDPDFVISCSRWSESFIDPLDRVKKIVVHPLIDAVHLSTPLAEAEKLPHCTALMINPQRRKGPEVMRHLISEADPSWTFRLLEGGWGQALQSFTPKVADTLAVREGRVDFRKYLRDIRQAYQSASLFFFPSLREGYGMSAVEAMCSGTPVVSSDYPAILEAVGDAAVTLSPYRSDPQDWKRSVAMVLSDRGDWCNRIPAHIRKLAARQDLEISSLCSLLGDIRP